MTGLKEGTGSLDLDEESDEEDTEESDQEAESTKGDTQSSDAGVPSNQGAAPDPRSELNTDETSHREKSTGQSKSEVSGVNIEDLDLPYLVRRQMRGASVNADRTKQLLLEVRPFVEEGETEFIDDLEALVDGPVYKGDAREAAMVVAQENPELVAEKLREWGIETLDQ